MIKLFTPDGKEIVGTLEVVQGCALIDGLDDKGELVYTGETKIYWDTQTTELCDNGSEMVRVFLDAEGDEWLESVLVRKEVED